MMANDTVSCALVIASMEGNRRKQPGSQDNPSKPVFTRRGPLGGRIGDHFLDNLSSGSRNRTHTSSLLVLTQPSRSPRCSMPALLRILSAHSLQVSMPPPLRFLVAAQLAGVSS